ncbi:hypothetical protein MRB53_014461 [Persea americana]|uniref:Uncharacterized protein n=1 Tax=Persea americana TaxID=3435 RepID=A0ACC2KB02_PERAE|nr:hypothetical protein MRB53_014461 [Persea americana]
MISSKRLVVMARKWQKIASIGRRRISTVKRGNSTDTQSCSSKSVADKGHFVVYTVDGRRFMVPLQYLKNPVFIELFRMSENAFGITSNGPITMPYDGVFMDHVVSLVRRRSVSKEVQRDLISTIANQRCLIESSMLHPNYQQTIKNILVHAY